MKKITIFVFAIIGIFMFTGLSSCKKIWDEIKHHPDGAADNCRVTQIVGSYFSGDYDEYVHETANFVYNPHGDPVRINRSADQSVYMNDKAFAYDNQHRVVAFIDQIQSHLSNVGLFWHTYTYSGASKIIDSLFVYPFGDYTVSYRPTDYDHVEVSTLTLDSWGRVVKEKYANGVEAAYNYDSNGNLVRSGVSYTNKTNLLQTHKTWMLVGRDYSINQPQGQVTEFNANNLPYKFNINQIFFGGFYFQSGVVTYSCK